MGTFFCPIGVWIRGVPLYSLPQGLHVVTELQMKINESNSVLVFLHETLKLARKR